MKIHLYFKVKKIILQNKLNLPATILMDNQEVFNYNSNSPEYQF